MNSINIVEVNNRRLLKQFVDFPNRLYQDNPYFVPAFYNDDINDWRKDKNPAFRYCDAKAFLAYKNDEIVGRIGAILNKRSNEKWNNLRMRFSQVDFIDDREVSKALFDTVEKWAKECGCNEVHGPLGFCDMDREGMLVEGFDKRSMFYTYYNHPYYNDHLKDLGYNKDVDWVEYKIRVPDPVDETYKRISKMAELIKERGEYHVAELKKRSHYKKHIKNVFELVNEAYSHLYGVVELIEEQINKYSDKFIPLINPDYCCLVYDKSEQMVGFGVCCPSSADAMQKHRGRLFPFGWIDILKALHKNTVVDLLLIAVKPELQKQGINAIIIDHIMKSCIKNGIKYAESGPQLEKNSNVLNQWKKFDVEKHKRRRCYIKRLV